MKTILFSFLCSLLIVHSYAGDLTEVTAVHSGYFPSNGQFYTNGWTNNLGKTIYIVRVWVILSPPTFSIDGSMNGYVLRTSDQNIMTYWNYPVCDMNNFPNGTYVETDFRPDWITIQPGDGITLQTEAQGFGGYNSAIALWFWYTTTP